MQRSRYLFLLLLAAALVNLAPVASSATGGEDLTTDDGAEKHCVAQIEDQLKDGQLVLADPVCFDKFDAAMRFVGVEADATFTPEQLTTALARASYIIAVHYDKEGHEGSSLAITSGTGQCNGGYINFRTHYTPWNGRFESVVYGCDSGPITHWDIAPVSGGNCSGSQYAAWSSQTTLGAMNNRTSCVVYG